MNTKISNIVMTVIIVLTFLVGLIVYPLLPDPVASHWNATGMVNGYMPKFWGIFLLPVIMIALTLLFLLIPRIDPFKKNIESFRKYYNVFLLVILIFLFYIYSLTIAWNLGYTFNITIVIIPALSILYYFMGSVMEKSKRNWFFGIRTPWTLSSDKVWEKTHKLGSKLFKISSLISLCGVFIQSQMSLIFILVPIIATSIIVSIYSYFEYENEQHYLSNK